MDWTYKNPNIFHNTSSTFCYKKTWPVYYCLKSMTLANWLKVKRHKQKGSQTKHKVWNDYKVNGKLTMIIRVLKSNWVDIKLTFGNGKQNLMSFRMKLWTTTRTTEPCWVARLKRLPRRLLPNRLRIRMRKAEDLERKTFWFRSLKKGRKIRNFSTQSSKFCRQGQIFWQNYQHCIDEFFFNYFLINNIQLS